ncbi:MAG TPA: cytidylate kinase family protein [Candidatus Paceibacterota bacterium]|nr:cytidylate kinase family protein [Candidatus Paceibacterota bacterium]
MAIITIGGHIGAGKTTIAARLANTLGYDELYMGGIMREFARERGMTIEEFYAELKNNPKLEQSIDERQAKLMLEHDDLVVQGRVAWFFAKGSPFTVYNIFLAVDPEVGAERSRRRPENATRSIKELAAANRERLQNEIERYRSLYGIQNFLDYGHYDFVLDTSEMDEPQVLGKILEKLHERIEPDM